MSNSIIYPGSDADTYITPSPQVCDALPMGKYTPSMYPMSALFVVQVQVRSMIMATVKELQAHSSHAPTSFTLNCVETLKYTWEECARTSTLDARDSWSMQFQLRYMLYCAMLWILIKDTIAIDEMCCFDLHELLYWTMYNRPFKTALFREACVCMTNYYLNLYRQFRFNNGLLFSFLIRNINLFF